MLLEFSDERPFATVKELTERLNLPVSTAYRYVSLLREMGLLEEAHGGGYCIGPRILEVARAARAANPIGDLAMPMMRKLSVEFDETAMLSQIAGRFAVCIASLAPRRAVRLTLNPGHPVPLHRGASGKTLLAFLTDEERSAYLDAQVAIDPAFVEERGPLEDELKFVRAQGGATASGEIDVGIWAAAAPVMAYDGRIEAALALAAPAYRVDEQTQDRIRQSLNAEAQLLTTTLQRHKY